MGKNKKARLAALLTTLALATSGGAIIANAETEYINDKFDSLQIEALGCPVIIRTMPKGYEGKSFISYDCDMHITQKADGTVVIHEVLEEDAISLDGRGAKELGVTTVSGTYSVNENGIQAEINDMNAEDQPIFYDGCLIDTSKVDTRPIILYLNGNQMKELSVVTAMSNIDASGVNAVEFNLRSQSGSVSVTDITATNLDINTPYGEDVTLDDIAAKNVHVQGCQADIDAQGVNAGMINFRLYGTGSAVLTDSDASSIIVKSEQGNITIVPNSSNYGVVAATDGEMTLGYDDATSSKTITAISSDGGNVQVLTK